MGHGLWVAFDIVTVITHPANYIICQRVKAAGQRFVICMHICCERFARSTAVECTDLADTVEFSDD